MTLGVFLFTLLGFEDVDQPASPFRPFVLASTHWHCGQLVCALRHLSLRLRSQSFYFFKPAPAAPRAGSFPTCPRIRGYSASGALEMYGISGAILYSYSLY